MAAKAFKEAAMFADELGNSEIRNLSATLVYNFYSTS
jgi:hypothetical protein